jgi:hypothetical protein
MPFFTGNPIIHSYLNRDLVKREYTAYHQLLVDEIVMKSLKESFLKTDDNFFQTTANPVNKYLIKKC